LTFSSCSADQLIFFPDERQFRVPFELGGLTDKPILTVPGRSQASNGKDDSRTVTAPIDNERLVSPFRIKGRPFSVRQERRRLIYPLLILGFYFDLVPFHSRCFCWFEFQRCPGGTCDCLLRVDSSSTRVFKDGLQYKMWEHSNYWMSGAIPIFIVILTTPVSNLSSDHGIWLVFSYRDNTSDSRH